MHSAETLPRDVDEIAPPRTPADVPLWGRIGMASVLGAISVYSFAVATAGQIGPESQEDWVHTYSLLLLDLRVLGPFAVVPIASQVSILAALVHPQLLDYRAANVGMRFAAAMAVAYLGLTTVAAVGFNLVLMFLGAFAAAFLGMIWRLFRETMGTRVFLLTALGLCGLPVALGVSRDADAAFHFIAVLLVASGSVLVFSGPALYLASCVWLLRCRKRPRQAVPLWIAALAMYIATWRLGVLRSIEVYNELPVSHSNCYIATAAATGHPQFVGSHKNPNGTYVNRQLRTFKAAELVLKEISPTVHRLLRTAYDVAGPQVAERIRNPWLGDISYVLLLPLELLARLVLCLVPRSHRRAEVSKIYQ